MSEEVTAYPVVSGVPVPEIKRHVREGTKYPFGAMNIGDHFPAKRSYSTLSKAIKRYMGMEESKGKRFVVRRIADGFGVWRVK